MGTLKKFPLYRITHSGLLRTLTPPTFKVYVTLWSYLQNPVYSEIRPSHQEIMRLTGLSHSSICRAISTLQDMGLLRVWKRALETGGVKNIYHIETDLDALEIPTLPEKKPFKSDYISTLKPKPRGGTFRVSDGHRLRSPHEALIDAELAALQIPHFPDIRYSKLAKTDRKYTVDFVLAPSIVLEYWGSTSPGYVATRKKKTAFLRNASIRIISIEEPDMNDLSLKINANLKVRVEEAWQTASLLTIEKFIRVFGLSEDTDDLSTQYVLNLFRTREEKEEAEASEQMMQEMERAEAEAEEIERTLYGDDGYDDDDDIDEGGGYDEEEDQGDDDDPGYHRI